ncbi:MAG: ABC transporter ATP-binding protein [Thermoanaerobaculia bacterium]
MGPAAAPSRALVDLRDLVKVYTLGEVEVRALDGISLAIPAGEFVAIMGPSGSGKSTLMNIVGCLDRPTSGTYILDGIDASGLDKNARAEVRNAKIGFVFQNFNLLARTTALENVELPMLYSDRLSTATERRERAREMLLRVGLKGREDHRPSQLSGGQQQRVAIARALVNDPAILLADEPTGNLDSKVSEEIMAILQELNAQGRTVITITHEPDIAQFAQRIVAFKDGRIVSDEPVKSRQIARRRESAA